MKLWRYTNGTGHLIMSVLMSLVGLTLILWPGLPAATTGVGIGLILTIQTAWFIPGAAKQVAHEVGKQIPSQPLTNVSKEIWENDTIELKAVKK